MRPEVTREERVERYAAALTELRAKRPPLEAAVEATVIGWLRGCVSAGDLDDAQAMLDAYDLSVRRHRAALAAKLAEHHRAAEAVAR